MKKASSYVPQQGSVAWRVIEFLTTNPDETLRCDDVAAKFGCGAASVHTLLRAGVAAGALVRIETGDGELEYRLGAGVPVIEAAPHKHPSLSRDADPERNVGVQSAVKKRRPPFRCDLDKVVIEKDVPLHAINASAFDWSPLLERLQPGDSFALPGEARSSIGAAITRYSKATGVQLIKRTVDGGIRVWRVK